MSDTSSIPTCGSSDAPNTDSDSSSSAVASCSNSSRSLPPATIDQIINFTLGTELVNGFYPNTYKGKKVGGQPAFTNANGAAFYPTNLGTEFKNFTAQIYASASSTEKNQYNNAFFQKGFYETELPMWKIGEKESKPAEDLYNTPKTNSFFIGKINYNVPTSDQSLPTNSFSGYYQVLGPAIQKYQIGFFVPDEDYKGFWDSGTGENTGVTSSQPDVVSATVGQIAPNTTGFTIPASDSYTVTNSSLVKRAFSANFDLQYSLEDQINAGFDNALENSVTEEVKAALDIDFSESTEKYSKQDETVQFDTSSTVNNPYDQTIFYEWVATNDVYNATYTLPGYLTAYQSNLDDYDLTTTGVSESPPTDQVFLKYENKNGKTLKVYFGDSVYDVLTNTASDSSGFSDTYSSSISPSNQMVSASGTYSANNINTLQPFFYFNNDDSCGSFDANDVPTLDSSGNCSTPSQRSIQSSRTKSSGLSWKRLKDFHDRIYVIDHLTIGYEDENGERDLDIGSRGGTKAGHFNIGTNQSDYHFNLSKKSEGGAILHEGQDIYVGYKKKDFVSSKALGGTTAIRTRGGKDRVLIDASAPYDEITHGYTHLGGGSDKYRVIGTTSVVDANDFKAEFVETGSGKDKIIVDGNAKLVVTDFDPFKDELVIDFNDYKMMGNHSDISFVNDEGSTITLQGLATTIHQSDEFDRNSLPESIYLVESQIKAHSDPYIADIHKFAYSHITGFVLDAF